LVYKPDYFGAVIWILDLYSAKLLGVHKTFSISGKIYSSLAPSLLSMTESNLFSFSQNFHWFNMPFFCTFFPPLALAPPQRSSFTGSSFFFAVELRCAFELFFLHFPAGVLGATGNWHHHFRSNM
jgi:hypothetical protein